MERLTPLLRTVLASDTYVKCPLTSISALDEYELKTVRVLTLNTR